MSSSTVKSGSALHLLKPYGCSSDAPGPGNPRPRTVPVSQEALDEQYQKDLAQLMKPENVRQTVAFYQTVFLENSTSQDRQLAATLVELLLENFQSLSEEAQKIVNDHIVWEPCGF